MTSFLSGTKWKDTKVNNLILKNILNMKTNSGNPIEYMTIVQNDTIPSGLDKQDMFVRGKTGSGKTLTFAAISLTNMLNNKKINNGNVKIVILTNTTSLCGQICEVFEELVKYIEPKLNICKFVGGESIGKQISMLLSGKCDIVVATMGTLEKQVLARDDLKKRFSTLECLILDECDKLLDISNRKNLSNIINSFNKEDRQTLMFSATSTPETKKESEKYLKQNYKMIEIKSDNQTNTDITHSYIEVNYDTLTSILMCYLKTQLDEFNKKNKIFNSIVFLDTNNMTEVFLYLFTLLNEKNVFGKNVVFHNFYGKLSPLYKSQVLKDINNFNNKNSTIVFASNAASTGLDFANVSHIIQIGYDDHINCIQRSGRTARGGNKGSNVLLLLPQELKVVIEEYKKSHIDIKSDSDSINIKQCDIKNLEYIFNNLDQKLIKLLNRAYSSYIGGSLKFISKLKMTKQELIDNTNTYFTSMGLPILPSVSKKAAGMMGLKSILRLKIV